MEAAGEEKLFLIVQVPVGAVVKQLRRSKKERSQRKGGREGEGEPLQKSRARGKAVLEDTAVHEYRAARMENGISRMLKAVDSLPGVLL